MSVGLTAPNNDFKFAISSPMDPMLFLLNLGRLVHRSNSFRLMPNLKYHLDLVLFGVIHHHRLNLVRLYSRQIRPAYCKHKIYAYPISYLALINVLAMACSVYTNMSYYFDSELRYHLIYLERPYHRRTNKHNSLDI
jgi:hypothetical protein